MFAKLILVLLGTVYISTKCESASVPTSLVEISLPKLPPAKKADGFSIKWILDSVAKIVRPVGFLVDLVIKFALTIGRAFGIDSLYRGATSKLKDVVAPLENKLRFINDYFKTIIDLAAPALKYIRNLYVSTIGETAAPATLEDKTLPPIPLPKERGFGLNSVMDVVGSILQPIRFVKGVIHGFAMKFVHDFGLVDIYNSSLDTIKGILAPVEDKLRFINDYFKGIIDLASPAIKFIRKVILKHLIFLVSRLTDSSAIKVMFFVYYPLLFAHGILEIIDTILSILISVMDAKRGWIVDVVGAVLGLVIGFVRWALVIF